MNNKPYISYEDFQKLDMRIGTIRFIEPVEGTDKLLRCEIDFGKASEPASQSENINDQLTKETEDKEQEKGDEHTEESETKAQPPFNKEEYAGRDVRQIVSGIREFFPDYEALVDKQVLYVVNLEPRTIRGVESQGMLMAVDGKDGQPVFLTPDESVDAGASVR